MEKTWETFWVTGKVEDYLSYCNSLLDEKDDKKELGADGTVGATDRDGAYNHAHIGL